MGRAGEGAWERVKCVRDMRWENSRARTGRERRGTEISERRVRASEHVDAA